jgi:hypothetical protein
MPSTEDTGAVVRNRDVATRGVLLSGFWLAVGMIAVALFVWGFFRVLERAQRREDKALSPLVAANLQRTPPEPRLEPVPRAPRVQMRAEEDAILGSYAWVDKSAGTVRVPIDRAMDLIAQRGLPPSKPTTAAPPAPAAPSGATP